MMNVSPMRLAGAIVFATALCACAATKAPLPVPDPCFQPVIAGPQILYPEDHARGVSVDVGEILYAQSFDLIGGTLYLKATRGIPVKPQGLAPKPYPKPHATKLEEMGPIDYATFGRLQPATRYEVKFAPPTSPPDAPLQLCSGHAVFHQTSFTTK